MQGIDAPALEPRPLSQLPGPPGVPFFGNVFGIRRAQMHHMLEGWAAQYGTPYRWSTLGRQFMTISDPKSVAAVLRDRPAGFDRPSRVAEISHEMGLPPGVFRANGAAWQKQRRIVMAGLDPAHVRAYHPSLEKVAQRLERRWRAAAQGGAAIDLQDDLMRYTVDTVAGLAFGSDVNTLESHGEVIQDHLDKIFPALRRRVVALFPYWRYFKFEADRRLERSVAEVMSAIDAFIAQARARLEATPALRERPSNLLEAMIVASEREEGVRPEDVSGNVLTMLLAGEDTTANSLAWMIELLVANPETLRKATTELREWVQPGRPLQIEAMPELPYLDACIQEAMRLKPVAPFIPAQANSDRVVEGVLVPQGTLVFCILRRETLDEGLFRDARAFQPQRWLDGSAAPAKHASIPFGAGARICPGRYLALLEMKIAMAVLLGRFDIESLSTPDGLPAAELFNFTMEPVGLSLKLRERS